MGLSSLRRLLLKKTDDLELKKAILSASDEELTSYVIESLNKMARPHASMGRSANSAVVGWANSLTNKDTQMIRDAVSHHLSRYKSALKRGKREVADAHISRLIPLLHLIARAAPHSGGQLDMDYVPLEAWESNYTTLDRRPETGKLIEGTKGLGRRPRKSTGQSKYGVSRSVPDYRYLEMPAHPEHPDAKKMRFSGGYPFEELQIGHSKSIDAGEGYIPIVDVEDVDKYVPHEFDFHPINSVADIRQDMLTPETMESYYNKMNEWSTSEHNTRWLNRVKQMFKENPKQAQFLFHEAPKKKPDHFFSDIKLIDPPEHSRKKNQIMDALPDELKSKFAEKFGQGNLSPKELANRPVDNEGNTIEEPSQETLQPKKQELGTSSFRIRADNIVKPDSEPSSTKPSSSAPIKNITQSSVFTSSAAAAKPQAPIKPAEVKLVSAPKTQSKQPTQQVKPAIDLSADHFKHLPKELLERFKKK